MSNANRSIVLTILVRPDDLQTVIYYLLGVIHLAFRENLLTTILTKCLVSIGAPSSTMCPDYTILISDLLITKEKRKGESGWDKIQELLRQDLHRKLDQKKFCIVNFVSFVYGKIGSFFIKASRFRQGHNIRQDPTAIKTSP
ncbi:hypothetical protein L1987_11650 [Smallanthus sonchifolius]|uniref:Uncharacterized protein n=1 Tax=Smallanthus sonchifolius TaxID=185202 RepID=A0ACB9JCG3_9ASTR|nr:hypothetical protein L1987_11650 [Smallanthus sonchifolius]